MREIKFRAWDTKYRVMFRVTGITNMNYDEANQYRYVVTADHVLGGATHQWLDITLMQYTGLKDKNGVEIYEGDLIRLVGSEIVLRPQEVMLLNAAFQIRTAPANDDWGLLSDAYLNYELEVIGNIYENPELLK